MGDGSSRRQRLHLRATLLLACLAQFMVILDVSVAAFGLPRLQARVEVQQREARPGEQRSAIAAGSAR